MFPTPARAAAGVQMLVVAELEEPFLPLPDELLVNLRDSRRVVEALLDSLPASASSASSNDSAMGPALQVNALGYAAVARQLQHMCVVCCCVLM
jgi:hypothetical protein